MKRALRLAEKGRGRTSPNPMVGAVLVKNGKVVGEGYHRKAGEPHAEMNALQMAGELAKGATLYTNLEPCSHYGKTPPCAPALIKAEITRVVVGMEDPNPLVSGRGLDILRKGGLEVNLGPLLEECQRLNEAFCKFILKKEPFVILKMASTIDGKIATQTGDSKWISGESSRQFVHRLRDEVDGLLVGIGTVLKDDPMLTARIKKGRDPYRIILDSRLRIPEEARVVTSSPEKTIIAATELAPDKKRESLEEKGVRVVILESRDQRVNLRALLSRLGEMGIMSLLVEGGSEVSGSFFDQNLIDKILLFLSPKLIGNPRAPGMFGGRGVLDLESAPTLNPLFIRRIGKDILLEGYLKNPCSQES